jgi:hypothetical protein
MISKKGLFTISGDYSQKHPKFIGFKNNGNSEARDGLAKRNRASVPVVSQLPNIKAGLGVKDALTPHSFKVVSTRKTAGKQLPTKGSFSSTGDLLKGYPPPSHFSQSFKQAKYV